MPTPRVVDLSHWNTIPDSLHSARAAGIWAVIHKATEGTDYVDPKLEARFHLAKDAGLLWGAYHFIRPGRIADQAEFFVHTMVPYTDSLTLFALDFEVDGVTLAECRQWLDIVERATRRSCVLYSGHQLKDAIIAGENPVDLPERRLWLAQYASKPTLPKGWSTWWLWQYSDNGDVPGIDPPTDLNAYEGGIEELEATWSGHAVMPGPSPEPTVASVGITGRGPVEVAVNGKIVYPEKG